MKPRFICLLALLFLATLAQGQYHRFSNPVTAPMLFNPAFAGSVDDYRVTLMYRNATAQAPGFASFYGAYDQVSHRLHGAFGAEVYHDRMTDNYIDTRFSAIYAGKFRLGGRWTLSPALRANYQRIHFDGIYIVNGLLSDRIQMTRHGLSFSPALLLNTSNFYVGITADHLFAPALQVTTSYPSDFRLDPNRVFKLQSGYRFQPRLTDKWSLAITGLGLLSNNHSELQGNLMYNRGWLLAGAGVRYGESPLNGSAVNYQASLGFKHQYFRLMGVFDTHSSQFNLSLLLYLPRKKVDSPSPESPGM